MKVDGFLQQNLRPLFAKIKQLDALNVKVSDYLDPTLKNHCQVANLVDNQLILIALNGSVATQLRFSTPDLLAKFKHDPLLRKIQSIHCKVHPAANTAKTTPTPKMPRLSPKTAIIINEIAETIADATLKKALQKIAGYVD